MLLTKKYFFILILVLIEYNNFYITYLLLYK